MSTDNNTLIRCEMCRGTKRIIALGLLEKQCPGCIGIGWIAKEPIDIKKKVETELIEPKVFYKKRGRKPKIQLQVTL